MTRNRVLVRQGRQGRSLRVDGTHASLYRPGRATTGSVWDALAVPLVWLPRRRDASVLILGLGGGSAARLVRAVSPRARIVGIERSAEVIRAARRWFDLDALGVDVHCADARRFLARSRAHFDVVIEDVFIGTERTVRKPQWMIEGGLAAAARRLRPGGLLVSNSIDETREVAREMRRHFPALVRIDVDGFDNRVLVGGPRGLSGRGLRSAVAAHPLLAETREHLTFRKVP
ncbi:MAG: spermidine synthase [Myxococcota bacterium]